MLATAAMHIFNIVTRTAANLNQDSKDIFADCADRKQKQTRVNINEQNHGSPAGQMNFSGQILNEIIQSDHKAAHWDENAAITDKLKWQRCGKNFIEYGLYQFKEGIVWPAPFPFIVLHIDIDDSTGWL